MNVSPVFLKYKKREQDVDHIRHSKVDSSAQVQFCGRSAKSRTEQPAQVEEGSTWRLQVESRVRNRPETVSARTAASAYVVRRGRPGSKRTRTMGKTRRSG